MIATMVQSRQKAPARFFDRREPRWLSNLKYTHTGYFTAMCQKDNKALRARLKRIEGQVRGVSQMVADDRYCIDILHQIHAIKAALAKVETEILKTHAACCVEEAIAAGDADAQRRKFSELVEVFAKAKL
ncbi:metal-sensitive transcriptional regulator [Pannonibacter sp. Q-1]|uniref:DNA-binding FrmR family transcriptional regulator n=11 Tax=Alphaproteobacteria TaxID=28211 RepID=A0A7W5Z775_9HYPH|nr:protein of unknown function DUF156 [Brucella anthropi ATCC 49188]MBB3811125.1 DNA-binding FrmR family transcriptional regulator [Pseudochelatococcus contaminans]